MNVRFEATKDDGLVRIILPVITVIYDARRRWGWWEISIGILWWKWSASVAFAFHNQKGENG